jgi:hypothetical protein
MLSESRIKHSLLELSSNDPYPSYWGADFDFPKPLGATPHTKARRKT